MILPDSDGSGGGHEQGYRSPARILRPVRQNVRLSNVAIINPFPYASTAPRHRHRRNTEAKIVSEIVEIEFG